jgi:biopolymer transport protein ExbD
MRRALVIGQPDPLVEMNTTPLIDVLLVLLVMFIITIPIQTHAVKIDLPAACAGCPVPDRKANTITIGANDEIAWNGTPVSRASLSRELRITQQMRPVPELHLRPDAQARYGTVDEVLAAIKREDVEKFGFVGNEAHRNIF